MTLTILLINFALIKIIYIFSFLVLVVFINLFCLTIKEEKGEKDSHERDTYISESRFYEEKLERHTTKN